MDNAFEQRVWALLRDMPYGQTRSYGDRAQALGDVGFSQAVGAANGRNPLGIIVPCHRVVGADGSLVGYAGGLDRKRFLLALEEPRRPGQPGCSDPGEWGRWGRCDACPVCPSSVRSVRPEPAGGSRW